MLNGYSQIVVGSCSVGTALSGYIIIVGFGRLRFINIERLLVIGNGAGKIPFVVQNGSEIVQGSCHQNVRFSQMSLLNLEGSFKGFKTLVQILLLIVNRTDMDQCGGQFRMIGSQDGFS